MKIEYVRGMWGMAEHSLEANLQKIKEGGFDHVEMGAPASAEDRDELKTLLAKYELGFIGQQWSRGTTLAEHAADLEAQVRANADMGAVLINSHTGKDHWDQADNLALVQKAHELEAELGVMITHEIHRGRMTFCSTHAMALLDADPTIKFTADFSHWCCVAESLLQDQLDRVERAMQRSYHVHARVGHEQGPQITHPLAPEWKRHVDAHFAWWDRIVELRKAEGVELLTICPEFGPVTYMPTIPFTKQPVADLWEVNHTMLGLLKDRYGTEA